MVSVAKITDALRAVRDPELDESIVELGFVADIDVDDDEVRVRLRLPTYFCAPNFAYLMVADAKEAIGAVAHGREARVELDDHCASDEINRGVAHAHGFDGTFPGLADGPDLEELRLTFRRKALVVRQDRLCRSLMDAGLTGEQLAALRLADLPASEERDVYLSRRAELGYGTAPDAPLLIDAWGRAVPPDHVVLQLRVGRTTRVSIEGNAGFCRGLLATRYGTPEAQRQGVSA
jgi:metal-sulfur cluster biosynthetic enzyme